MPVSAERPDLLVDTSVAVALSVVDHRHHDSTFLALADRRLGLAGRAAFQAVLVLAPLPPPPPLPHVGSRPTFRTAAFSGRRPRRSCSPAFTWPRSPGEPSTTP